MYRFKGQVRVGMRSLGIAMFSVVIIAPVAAMSGSCFGTETTLCEQSGLRCRPDQVCAANQPVCIEGGGCGDNHIDEKKGEICDDGNIIDGDGCSHDCKSMEICENGITDIAVGEECDDGNRVDGDGCNSSCKSEKCGDKVVDANEQCDTGGDSPTCNHNCTTARCGDGYPNLAAGENCDSGGMITSDCNAHTCKVPRCGDSYYDRLNGEQCDTGGDSQACNGNGNAISRGSPSTDCQIPRCGDHYINIVFTPPGAMLPETCDTGPDDTTECNGNSHDANGPGSCQPPSCGDGYVNSKYTPDGAAKHEECDTGNKSQHIPPVPCSDDRLQCLNCNCI